MKIKKVMLIILDGFGLRREKDYNAVTNANTPYLDYLVANYPHDMINASGKEVGLPVGQFGNSEVGHLNIGAGRVVRQDISKIDYEIETRAFYTNKIFTDRLAKLDGNNLHIFGLLSDGGVHAHINHIIALVDLASNYQQIKKVWLHMFLDGRDTPPQSAIHFVEKLHKYLQQYPQIQIATICGRYYAMDRDKRYDRVELAYNAITQATGHFVANNDWVEAITNSYQSGVNDEFIKPLVSAEYSGVKDHDGIIFANFRSDRAIELTDVFVNSHFSGFVRNKIDLSFFITMTAYSSALENVVVAYPKENIRKTLGECVSAAKLHQLRIAETEKYPHITYFFNGGRENPFEGEERILVDSPRDVATYDLKPEMSLPMVSEKLVEAINSDKYELIITNFANGDMVGHSGSYNASIKAVEAIDIALSKVVPAMLEHGGEVIVIADHGNCEQMYDYISKQPHTQHTTNLVPFIYVGESINHVKTGGCLADVAPTILALMGLDIPVEMTGTNLLG